MRHSGLIFLLLLTACASSDSGPGPERRAYFESVVRQAAGPGAHDCGTTGPRFPSDEVRTCAATHLTRRDPFFAIRYEQGVGADVGTGWVFDGANRLFVVDYDGSPCGNRTCGVTLSQCESLEILQEWDWFRPGGCERRELPAGFADPAAPGPSANR